VAQVVGGCAASTRAKCSAMCDTAGSPPRAARWRQLRHCARSNDRLEGREERRAVAGKRATDPPVDLGVQAGPGDLPLRVDVPWMVEVAVQTHTHQFEEGFATSLPSHQMVVNNVEIQVETVTAATPEASMEQEVSTAVSELQSSRATSALEVCCPRLGSITLLSAVSPPPPSQAPVETTAPLGPPVLGLSNSPPWPQLGSPALPTVGSASHQQGFCWPCPFYHTTGCANGVDCTFCHLCKPGEKNRRRKERLATRRAAQIRGPPPMQEVLSLFFMNPKKAKRRAGKIGGAAGTRDDAVVVTTGRTARR